MYMHRKKKGVDVIRAGTAFGAGNHATRLQLYLSVWPYSNGSDFRVETAESCASPFSAHACPVALVLEKRTAL